VVDGNSLMEEEAVRDGALPGVVAGGSSSEVLLHLQRKTVVRFIGSDGNGVRWGGARRRAEWWAQARQSKGREAEIAREEEGKGDTTPPPPQRWIRTPRHG
jgi:hypothetical protein